MGVRIRLVRTVGEVIEVDKLAALLHGLANAGAHQALYCVPLAIVVDDEEAYQRVIYARRACQRASAESAEQGCS